MEGVLKTIADKNTLIELLNLGEFERWMYQSIDADNINLDIVADLIIQSIKGAHPSIRKYNSLHITGWDNENDPGHLSIILYEVYEEDTIYYDENGSVRELPDYDGSDVYTLDNRLLVFIRRPVNNSQNEIGVHYGYVDDIPRDILRLFE